MSEYTIRYDLRSCLEEHLCYWAEFYYVVMLLAKIELGQCVNSVNGSDEMGQTYTIIKKMPDVQIPSESGQVRFTLGSQQTALVINHLDNSLWLATVSSDGKVSIAREFGAGLNYMATNYAEWRQLRSYMTNEQISAQPLTVAYRYLEKSRANRSYSKLLQETLQLLLKPVTV